ncbi:taurine catabolism dioxygenase [Phlyctema vagabunda]|uniref:Taurine catabolism dioxygenase n=1 Tax=Phlyctema vagabunda TaxID=108571 RepID=A0ABR4P6Z3_9HELO
MSSDKIIRQIALHGSHLEQSHTIEDSQYIQELEQFRASLLKSCQEWPDGLDILGSPLPVLVPEHFLANTKRLSDILGRAITSIVERWWIDSKANFPGRMPISPQQEAVLRWMDGPGKILVKPFSVRQGVWRPDFLLSDMNHERGGRPQICEINARFCLNGFFVTAFAHEALQEKAAAFPTLKPAAEPENMYTAYKNLVNADKPIYLLKAAEKGIDIHLYAPYMRNRYGMIVRFIKPGELRLIQNANFSSDCKLCCTVDASESNSESEAGLQGRFVTATGEVVEEIHQVILELHQSELEGLGHDILQALAPVCINDLRSIFLVHDKRMLGMVLQEIPSLVDEHHILTAEEAEILRLGIVPTILPGSTELRDLIGDIQKEPDTRDQYLLKPIGSGKGDGIIFGGDTSKDDFTDSLERLSNESAKGQLYVVQRVISQARYHVVIPEENNKSAVLFNHFVGTFMMIDGRYLGLGLWRTSKDRICAVSSGGTWMVSFQSAIHSPVTVKTRPVNAIRISDVPRICVSYLNESVSKHHVNLVNEALQKDGILILDLRFDDPGSSYLLQLIHGLKKQHNHGPPLTHSSTRGWFWDVKPDAESMARKHSARSETMEDFPWHTDCSYDSRPPRFFGLHVLQADRCGGGTLSVMQTSRLVDKLSEKTIQVLCEREFRIQVPPEFSKDTGSNSNGNTGFTLGSLLAPMSPSLTAPDASSQMRFRFRADIVQALSARAEEALDELNQVLREARQRDDENCLRLAPDILPNGSIVLLDNSRWIHARNRVQDAGRHLRRIRWDAMEF